MMLFFVVMFWVVILGSIGAGFLSFLDRPIKRSPRPYEVPW